jgi:hypothetical protein
MSGELINTQNAIDKKDIFNRGTGNFSSKSINELFDVDGDGNVSGVEKELMGSMGVLNSLDSISPAVAHAFKTENFRIQTGSYLTESQRVTRDKLLLSINKTLMLERLKDIDIKKRINEEEPAVDNSELDTNDLQEDIKHRQYLNRAEIDNNV